MKRETVLLCLFLVAGALLAAGCATTGTAGSFTLTSGVISPNGTIPIEYTCTGANISPPLEWKNVPPDTQSLALTVVDTDVMPAGFTHWVIYDIPPVATGLLADRPKVQDLPDGSSQGLNGRSAVGYTGPCPPSGVHHYHFRLYALNNIPEFREPANRTALENAMTGHILGTAELTGTFGR